MKLVSLLALLAALAFFPPAHTAATADPLAGCQLAQQQDCCKANKGICGCRAGKIVCCDKTFSEGCTCNREDAPLISS